MSVNGIMSANSVMVIPQDVLTVLAVLLSHLMQGDNRTRSDAEKDLNEQWITRQPEHTILALAELCRTHPSPDIRSFAGLLIRRHLTFELPSKTDQSDDKPDAPKPTVYSVFSLPLLSSLQTTLLYALDAEPVASTRRKTLSAVTAVACEGLELGRQWAELLRWVINGAARQDGQAGVQRRQDAFGVVTDAPGILKDLNEQEIGQLLEGGLKDQSAEVRVAAIQAAVAYLSTDTLPRTAPQVISLVLSGLPSMPQEHLPNALQILIPFASQRPKLFTPHLQQLLSFLIPFFLAAPSTPTPLHPSLMLDDERELTQASALELMLSLSEASATQVKKVPGWAGSLVRVCLEGMGGDELEEWPEWGLSKPDEDDDHGYPLAFEQAIDRLTIAIGGKTVVPITFNYVPQMLQNPDWKARHAGLMAVASLGEGGANVIKHELYQVVSMVTVMFGDPHPRVRYAACQCLGQLCTDLEGAIQEAYHCEIFTALLPTLADPVPRVHAHAASALINFCEGVPKPILGPYLRDIVPCLLALLSDNSQRYVQEQVLTTLAMVADAAEEYFIQYYGVVMPVLVNVMRNARTKEYRLLRSKAMECAGLIAIAVGKDKFGPDANQFCEILANMQNDVHDSDDPLAHYLMGTWCKVCQALDQDFEPYLPYAMPPLLQSAGLKPELTVLENELVLNREAYEVVDVGGQEVGIRTAVLEEKCAAYENLAVYAAKLGPKFAPYLPQTFELAVPGLQFVFHEGVREAATMMIPQLLRCAALSGLLTMQMVEGVFQPLTKLLSKESDPGYLSSLYTCFAHSVKYLGGPGFLNRQLRETFETGTQGQLQDIADRRRLRHVRVKTQNIPADEAFELELFEETEDNALTSITAALQQLDQSHPLLLVVSHVRDLAVDWTSDDD